MNEKQFETKLHHLLERVLRKRDGRVATYEEQGVLTHNRGLVVRLASGAEFHLTIVQSRDGRREA
jgi:hypothetical protein